MIELFNAPVPLWQAALYGMLMTRLGVWIGRAPE